MPLHGARAGTGPWTAFAAVLTLALAGCTDGGHGPPGASAELREHGVPETYVPGDHRLLAAPGDPEGFLETLGMTANPGLANVTHFSSDAATPRLAWGALFERATAPEEIVASFALEFASQRQARAWAEGPLVPSSGPYFLVLDAPYVTLVLPLDEGDLDAADEAARRLAAFLGVSSACHNGAWPPAPDRGADRRTSALPLEPTVSQPGGLGFAGEEEWYRLEVTAPSLVTVDLAGKAGALGLQLLDGNLGLLATGLPQPQLAGIPVRIQRAVEPGTHYLRVLGSTPCAVADYVVSAWPVATALDQDGGAAQATPLEFGPHGPFTLYPGTDEDWYRFDLTERSRVTVTVREARGELGGGTRMWLYRDEGQLAQVGFPYDNPEPDRDDGRAVNDLGPGTYYVRLLSLGEQVVFQYYLDYSAGPAP